ncbi:hypothetical protein BD847_1465 [Flavobacterium cutihirudinis]|uniref:Uncharacterized protein n=1 Tax=Flavobacterium cutihirudinis TaxID=1265740 RepID=A0A3D9FVE8_9FLAO|nr:hypothetical protein [Flavobacterium cutihirudinis]RED24730.1 hypothetical protein BD847_1465 [Flavobacterium cutihirudinis]
MKKTALTFGLFSLVVVATSFSAPENVKSSTYAMNTSVDIDGGQKTGQDRKLDVMAPIDGGQKTGQDRKLDFANVGGFGSDSQSATANRKID